MKTKQLYRTLFFLILFPFLIHSQTNFNEYFENPVLKRSVKSWDSYSILTSSVVFDGEKYRMYYTAKGSNEESSILGMDIGYATSENGFDWEKELNNPIFKHDTLGWEKNGYIEPIVLKVDNQWQMWYLVPPSDEPRAREIFQMGYATSKDGLSWERYGEEKYGEPLGINVIPYDIIYDGSKYLMYYNEWDSESNNTIGVAVSEDGIHWVKDTFNNPVIVGGGDGALNKYIWNCDVIFEENNPEYAFEMWYIGYGDYRRDKIFYAKSKDGKNWLEADNPILDCEQMRWSRYYYEDVEVVKRGSKYQLWVNGLSEHSIENAGFGYFEDFSSCMHCDNVVCNTKYNLNGSTPEEFTAHLCNKDCNNFQVWARIECDLTKHSELYRMVQSDQSNAEFIIEEPVRCNNEGFFTFSTFLKNMETNEVVFDSRNFDMVDKYTTAGPVKAISYDLEMLSGDKYVIKNIELKNFSDEAKINQLSVTVKSKNNLGVNVLNSGIPFGNLDPAQSRLRESGIAFEVDNNVDELELVLEIRSNKTVYWSQSIVFDPVGVEEEENIPTEYALNQNYPNPFNPSTTIKYSIPNVETLGHASVRLVVYDILGKEVATLVNENQNPGYYEVEFDASKMATGIYIYELQAGASTSSATNSFVETKKMLMIK